MCFPKEGRKDWGGTLSRKDLFPCLKAALVLESLAYMESLSCYWSGPFLSGKVVNNKLGSSCLVLCVGAEDHPWHLHAKVMCWPVQRSTHSPWPAVIIFSLYFIKVSATQDRMESFTKALGNIIRTFLVFNYKICLVIFENPLLRDNYISTFLDKGLSLHHQTKFFLVKAPSYACLLWSKSHYL